MKELTNAEFAILSLLVEQSRHGYEIEQVIEVRGMREWTEVGFSSIYYLLRKMAAEGLIEGHSEKSRGRGPARKVFRVTEEGVDAWRAATLSALTEPQPCYPRIQLGLSNLPALPQAEVLAALRKYRFNLDERLGHVKLLLAPQLDMSQTLIEVKAVLAKRGQHLSLRESRKV